MSPVTSSDGRFIRCLSNKLGIWVESDFFYDNKSLHDPEAVVFELL